eukprot:CAMPEP_0198242570 /NCGR_PEP_ID=MMETSP1446-20131203/17728_1 /TAXON_ID=1461542 ORGANISM="Unidentified sp, Strain CCMP2111" /NCGR_SAMPLE_ID=MMETSP1446 /ASSEMBLY_ACC=CAM_ASM_001112 /LENGTH=327 /DNA_ID=CAMNT_0043926091 /DNA_START=265 /DNA_END=1244 /DNA_ORIENTATION=+
MDIYQSSSVGRVRLPESLSRLLREKKGKVVAVVALTTTQTVFGLGTVYLKWTLSFTAVHPMVLALYRDVLAGLIFILITARLGRPQKKHIVHFLGAGFCLFLNQVLFIVGVDLSGAMVATCIQPSQPIITFIVAVLIGQEKIDLNRLLGLTLSVVGAVWVVLGDAFLSNANVLVKSLLGDVCLVANCAAMAVCYILVKALVSSYSPVVVIAYTYASAVVPLVLTTPFFIKSNDDWVVPKLALPTLAFLVLVVSVLGYSTISWSSKHLDSSQVSAFTCLQPLVGSIGAAAFLKEEANVQKIVGGVLITLGLLVSVVEKHSRYQPWIPG